MRLGGIKRGKEKNEAIQKLDEIHGENQDQGLSCRKDPVIAIKSAQGQKEIDKDDGLAYAIKGEVEHSFVEDVSTVLQKQEHGLACSKQDEKHGDHPKCVKVKSERHMLTKKPPFAPFQ